STELGNFPDFTDTPRFTRNLLDAMGAAGADIGIGRYDEARPIYTSDAYRVEGNDGPEWRTLHIGLDLFMAPGTPVFAPLDGVVHSFENNAAPKDYGPTIILEHAVSGHDGAPLTFYTLYGHLSLDSLDGLYEGRPIARGAELGRIGDASVNGDWPPHLHLQLIPDLLGKRGDFPGVALPSQRALWLSLSPDPNLLLAVPEQRLQLEHLEAETIVTLRRSHLGPNLSISYRRPLHIVRGYLQHLYDTTGRSYLDAVNNVAH